MILNTSKMKSIKFLSGLIMILLLPAGCGSGHDSHEGHDDHGQEDDHAAHGEEEEGLPAQSVTIWAEKTELFMEYEPLIVNKPSRFAAHLTTMSDFKAVTSGVLTLAVTLKDGTVIREKSNAPASPGIFRFNLTPKKSAPCSFSLTYAGQGIEDTIEAGKCQVFADKASAIKANPEEESGIAYTKEAAWKIDFANEPVAERSLQPSVQSIGDIKAVSGREARITAPARGRISISKTVPFPGMKVTKGQLLGTVSPYLAAGGDRSTLQAESLAAKAELSAAQSQFERMERLLEEKAIPERRVEDARASVSVAKARLNAATGRLRQYSQGAAGMGGKASGGFKLRSPIDGTLVEIKATSGDSVEEGMLLFVVVDLSRVWLVARVFEPDIPRVESATSAWFTIEGYDTPFTITEDNGRLVTVGQVIDPESRTVPVIFEMENPDGKIRIGQFAKVYVSTGAPTVLPAIPVSALLDDGGKQVVFVQLEGETFERRVVQTGIESKGWVEVRSGVELGERVVTKGAYDVRLAAASGAIPERGHVH